MNLHPDQAHASIKDNNSSQAFRRKTLLFSDFVFGTSRYQALLTPIKVDRIQKLSDHEAIIYFWHLYRTIVQIPNTHSVFR